MHDITKKTIINIKEIKDYSLHWYLEVVKKIFKAVFKILDDTKTDDYLYKLIYPSTMYPNKIAQKAILEHHLMLCYHDTDIVGFSVCILQRVKVENNEMLIARNTSVLLSDYRNNIVASTFVRWQFIHYYLKYVHENIYAYINCFSPISYHAICKSSKYVYPRIGGTVSEKLKNDYLQLINFFDSLIMNMNQEIPLKTLPFASQDEPQINSKHITYYLSQNRNFRSGFSIPVIIPFLMGNIFHIISIEHAFFRYALCCYYKSASNKDNDCSLKFYQPKRIINAKENKQLEKRNNFIF